MNQSARTNASALQEAFYILSTEQEVPDARLLDDLVRRYPEFGEELTEFAISIALDTLTSEHVIEDMQTRVTSSAISPTVSRAISYFQNRLHSMKEEGSASRASSSNTDDVLNPFSELSRDEFRSFASSLNANSFFVVRLRDRQIEPKSMTMGFKKRVAELLNASNEIIVAHFAASQSLSASQFFKAERKLSFGERQSFEDAVKNSGLSKKQQRHLMEL